MPPLIPEEAPGLVARLGIGVLQRWLFHLACIFALAWPAFVNGQPFYFPDTTAYVRAADSAAYIFSGHRIHTEWTDHYRQALEPEGKLRQPQHHVGANANDLGTDSIMAGRSPYFGAWLWLSYLFGHFWLFVLAQAAISYALIRISLRLFSIQRPAITAGCVGVLAIFTSLPFFAALLMPDLLAAFAVLGFMLLSIDRGRLRRAERFGLYALMLMSVVAHITHILIIAVMAAVLLVWALLRRWPRTRFATLMGASALILVAGVLSVTISSAVIENVFGRKPLLAPLLTARFLADGPGLDYLDRHCPDAGFAACAYRRHNVPSATAFLWSTDPRSGGYMLADARTRRALSVQDYDFALAVLRAYPRDQGERILRNGWLQFISFDSDLTNYHCAGVPRCWSSLPSSERARLMASVGGRDLWPERPIHYAQYAIVLGALIFSLWWILADRRSRSEGSSDLLLWFALLLVALMVNALLGGGISEPQPRYQARLIWLLPFIALLARLIRQRHRTAGSTGG